MSAPETLDNQPPGDKGQDKPIADPNSKEGRPDDESEIGEIHYEKGKKENSNKEKPKGSTARAKMRKQKGYLEEKSELFEKRSNNIIMYLRPEIESERFLYDPVIRRNFDMIYYPEDIDDFNPPKDKAKRDEYNKRVLKDRALICHFRKR